MSLSVSAYVACPLPACLCACMFAWATVWLASPSKCLSVCVARASRAIFEAWPPSRYRMAHHESRVTHGGCQQVVDQLASNVLPELARTGSLEQCLPDTSSCADQHVVGKNMLKHEQTGHPPTPYHLGRAYKGAAVAGRGAICSQVGQVLLCFRNRSMESGVCGWCEPQLIAS